MQLQGGCYCGAVRYCLDGEPAFRGMCFCRACQHNSGGGPAIILGLPAGAFTYTRGAAARFAQPDLAAPVTREFCGTCGTPLLSRSPRAPGMVLVKAGSLDDPSAYGMPKSAVYLAEAQPYHAVAPGIEQFAARPGG